MRARRKRLRAVSFDVAGTLMHPVRPVAELYAEVAGRHGAVADPACLAERFRRAFGAAPPLAFPGVPPAQLHALERAWWRAVVAEVFAGLTFPSFDAAFEELFALFARPSTWRLDPATPSLLRALRAAELRILIISNFDARVRGILDGLGVTPFVDQITLSSEAGAAKPDPRIFEVALTRAALAADEVVHVGDTVDEDLAGGRAAGIPVLLLGSADAAVDAPDATVVASLERVRDWLLDRRPPRA